MIKIVTLHMIVNSRLQKDIDLGRRWVKMQTYHSVNWRDCWLVVKHIYNCSKKNTELCASQINFSLSVFLYYNYMIQLLELLLPCFPYIPSVVSVSSSNVDTTAVHKLRRFLEIYCVDNSCFLLLFLKIFIWGIPRISKIHNQIV